MDGTNIVRSDDLRNENRRRVLQALRSHGSCPPAQLTKDTGLSAASISSLISQMADQGIVRSSRQKAENVCRGRPQSLIELNAGAGDIVTISLAMDSIHAQRVSYAGGQVHDHVHDIDSRTLSETQLFETTCQAIEQSMAHNNENKVERIGVAFQGVTTNTGGVLAWSPIIAHQNVKLGSTLHDTFHLPVSVNNDCQLIAEALSRSSEQLADKSFATILFSHGVGLGLYFKGKPFSGIRTSALELGHLRFERNGALCRCARRGCIEAYAADYGIQRLATGKSIHDDPVGRVDAASIDAICAAGQAGDEPALQAFAIAGAAIGEGLATLFTLLDPMPVALVGRSQQGIELMRAGVNSVFREQRLDSVAIDELLHCFDDAEPLLASGLVQNTLTLLDQQFSYAEQLPSNL